MNDKLYTIKRKQKKVTTIWTVLKSNRKIVTSGKIATPNIQIHDSLFWLVAGLSIKYGGDKLVLFTPILRWWDMNECFIYEIYYGHFAYKSGHWQRLSVLKIHRAGQCVPGWQIGKQSRWIKVIIMKTWPWIIVGNVFEDIFWNRYKSLKFSSVPKSP